MAGAAPAANRQASRSVTATGRSTVKPPPLSADQVSSRTVAGKTTQTTSHLVRDSHGRTRVESGALVTISDPASRTTIRMNTGTHAFLTSTAQPADRPAPSTAGSQTLATPPASLGSARIEGVAAEGRAYTVTVPTKNGKAIQKDVTIWLAAEVQLPVQTRIVDRASGDENTLTYTNIRAGTEPAADLFAVPAGFRQVDSAAALMQPAEATSCPLEHAPDPLVLNSFDFFLDSGTVNAVTDPQRGCVFVADGAAFEYPLSGFPTVPLGLPFDQWVAYDTGGGGLPFLPWVAFGDVAFVAANTTDATTKDSLVILTVWCC